MNYLHIDIDGNAKQSQAELTDDDKASIADGDLQCFKTEDDQFFTALVEVLEAEGDAEETEYELTWTLVSQ